MRLKQADFTVWAQVNDQVFSSYTTFSVFLFGLLFVLSISLISTFTSPKKK